MKKYISYLISIWLLTTMLAACTDETTNFTVQDEQGMLTLQLSSKTLATRAVIGTEAGEDAWNENAIKSVDCFFYPNGKTGEAAVFSATGLIVDATGTATLSIKIPNDKVEALFGTGNTCKAYTIVNRPAASVWGLDTSISGLKKTVIEAEGFATQGSEVTAQESFVMDGEGDITLVSDRKSMTGSIDLYRAASKISLFITKVEETVTDEAGNKWTSQPENMRVFFHNGVKKAHVDVSADGCAYTIQPEDYFNFSLNGETRGFTSVPAEDGSTEYYKHAPFYSYSSDWNNDEEHEAYLTLVVPWKKEEESEFKSCYYQVPVNVTNKKFERNNYYKIKLSVGILGDFKPETSVELNPSYIIVDWGSGEVTANIKEYRYLVVDKNSVVMNNTNSIDISFLSSHDVELVNATMSRPVLVNGKDNEYKQYNAMDYLQLDKNGHKITFSHILNNNQTEINNYDYVPYTIKFDVRHKDKEEFVEHIEIVQYPALYIKADKNPGSNDWGNVYINGNYSKRHDWNEVNGILNSGNNSNPNMYIISVSAFSKGSEYIIADPRSTTPVEMGFTAVEDNDGKKLTYYYPTMTGETYKNYIAPKFRICSAYGRLSGDVKLTKKTAEYRCASYQEDGYPAGRWRLPTSAELQFIGKVCAEGKIPPLFWNGQTYWCASGGYKYNNNGTFTAENNANYVRCVYDEWYWTDTVDEDTFTWGDKQR